MKTGRESGTGRGHLTTGALMTTGGHNNKPSFRVYVTPGDKKQPAQSTVVVRLAQGGVSRKRFLALLDENLKTEAEEILLQAFARGEPGTKIRHYIEDIFEGAARAG